MSLQASGTSISFSQISNEFGTPPAHNLGAYRVSQTVSGLLNMPLDADVPQSGEIKFSDFYSKRLNVVVDYTVGSGSAVFSGQVTNLKRTYGNVGSGTATFSGTAKERFTPATALGSGSFSAFGGAAGYCPRVRKVYFDDSLSS